MNIENLDKAIAIMKRAQKHNSVNMVYWQDIVSRNNTLSDFVTTEEELHACGNKACFAGHLAISPEWLATEGFTSSGTGCPTYEGSGEYLVAEDAVSEWLGIDSMLACEFIRGGGDSEYHDLYKAKWKDVTAGDVIRELELLKEIGEEAYCNLYGI